MAIPLSTKARTLAALEGVLKIAKIAPISFFTANDWKNNREVIQKHLSEIFGNIPLIVRSSSLQEDQGTASNAGRFISIRDVLEPKTLQQAIDDVLASYGAAESANNEVLVQPMLSRVIRTGVAFTCDPQSGAPYRIVNYVEGSDTAAITGGSSGITFVHAQGTKVQPPTKMAPILALLDELEGYFSGQPLDIEFAVTQNDERECLYLLQVRPLVLSTSPVSADIHFHDLALIETKVAQGLQPHPFLHGRSNVFGVMPDWNPAEIIGTRPRPLALSLYRTLITDATWAYQRHNYGYKNLRSFPLMVHLHGQPYIDVRVSFNSFIPRDIEGGLADRLVDYYMDRLLAAPTLHDKVEFEIVFSCYTLDLPQRLSKLSEHGFSAQEQETLTNSLRRLTNQIIHPTTGLWRTDQHKLATLTQRREKILAADVPSITRIYWLLEDCKRYGTLPFAGLARAGFIAVQMLKSLVSTGVFSQDDYDGFMSSLNTVSGQLARDTTNLERTTFLAKYGHLRPGTYDILSARYDEAPDDYFSWRHDAQPPSGERRPFSLQLDQIRRIDRLLEDHGLEIDVVGLFDFLQAGIELREYAKFVFTRNLSDAMALMRGLGTELGFSVEDMSFADAAVFSELHTGCGDARELLAHSIAQGRTRYEKTRRLWLPPLITSPQDVWSFHLPETEPNFITQKSVTAPVVTPENSTALRGAIVAIPSADPGFDWLFSHDIAGLITAYGGVNSHMAIRAGEMGLPAVIGAGERLFAQWSQARQLVLDCASRRVVVLP